MAWYQGLNKVGLVSKEEVEQIRNDLSVASVELEETRKFNAELSQQVDKMILNNKNLNDNSILFTNIVFEIDLFNRLRWSVYFSNYGQKCFKFYYTVKNRPVLLILFLFRKIFKKSI